MTAELRRASLAVLTSGLVVWGTAACAGAPSPLDPRTGAAARMAELGWIMFALATGVCGTVLVALIVALRTPGQRATDPATPVPSTDDAQSDRVVVLTGMIVPAVILAFTLGYTVFTLQSVAGVGGAAGTTGPAAHSDHGSAAQSPVAASGSNLDIRITGRQWWWQISYPAVQVETANEIRVPAGVPVRLTVTSEDVIHSFWVPQIAGKVDVIPGRVNSMTIQVDQPGTYRGLCSEFCGLQHARMHLFMIVEPPDAFVAWIGQQQAAHVAAAEPLVQRGQIVLQDGCAECHTVKGTSAAGRLGPDLTHVASRQTLGAGTHQNSRATLEGWVRDPQGMKPGNKMPRPDLSEADMLAVLAYLESLK